MALRLQALRRPRGEDPRQRVSTHGGDCGGDAPRLRTGFVIAQLLMLRALALLARHTAAVFLSCYACEARST